MRMLKFIGRGLAIWHLAISVFFAWAYVTLGTTLPWWQYGLSVGTPAATAVVLWMLTLKRATPTP
jgi:hypothetical protein